ncbi:MAG TPA: hypothetical protein VN137_03120 [Sphingomonas sp.]|nr:hypothetical protein [Sphingomonas sp.]
MATLANPRWTSNPEAAAPRQTSTMIADLEPTYREILFSGLVVLWFAIGMGALPGSEDWINTIGLSAYALVLAWAAYHQMRRNVASVWTPLIWYRVAMLSYFGIGSMVPNWVNGDTLDMMKGFYNFFGYEVIKLDFLVTTFNLIFIITVKLIFLVMTRMRGIGSAANTIIAPSNFSMIAFGSVCLAVGCGVNYLVILPQTAGWVNFTYFSSIANFSALSWLGYFMVTYWALDNGKWRVLIIPIALSLGETAIGFLAMSKSVMLMPLIMISIGFIYQRPTVPRIAAFGTFFVSIFMVLSPAVAYARNINAEYYNGAARINEIPRIFISYFTRGSQDDIYSDVDVGWARLSFVNAGTFVINQYDHGMPGSSYRYWSIVWIPRVIYRDKPIITDVSRELSYAANGNYNSSSSAGLAPEAYWNGGWIATIGLAIFVAFVFGLWSIYSYEVIRRKAWHLFFVVLIGMRMSIRVDGVFVSDILGPLPLAVLAHIALELMNRFLPRALAGVTRRSFARN